MYATRNRMVAAWGALALLLASCGGGNSSGLLPHSAVPTSAPTSPANGGGTQNVTAVVTIDGNADKAADLIREHDARSANGGRQPMYVSASTNGITISVNGTSTAYNVSSGSPLCTSGSPRTCTLTIVAPVGSDTFTLDEYDQAPSGGSIPGTAKHLATTTLSQTIVANTANTINFLVSGIISGVTTSGSTTYASLPADGSAHTYSVALVVTDADGNTISGSVAYNNPITVTLAESGGSGNSYLVKNGSNVGASATLSYPSDTLSLHYNGGGSSGYTTTTAFSASGATGTTVRVSPMYLSGSVAFTDANQTKTLSATEASAPGNLGYSSTWTCSGFSKSAAWSGSTWNLSVTSPSLTAGSTIPSFSCTTTFTVTDTYGTSMSTTYSGSLSTASTCSNQGMNVYLGVKNGSNQYEIGSGSPCALFVGTSSGTIYTSGSTPTSFTSAISEANDTAAISLSGCSGIASLSTSSIAGSGSYTGTTSATLTISSSAVGTCSVTVNDNHSQTKTISVTVNSGTVTLVNTPTTETQNAADPCYPDPIDGTDCPASSVSFDIGYNGSNSTVETFSSSASYLAVNVTIVTNMYDCIVLHQWSGTTNYYYELWSNVTSGATGNGVVNTTYPNPHPGWSSEVWVEDDDPGGNNLHTGDTYASTSGSGTVTTAGSAASSLPGAAGSWTSCF